MCGPQILCLAQRQGTTPQDLGDFLQATGKCRVGKWWVRGENLHSLWPDERFKVLSLPLRDTPENGSTLLSSVLSRGKHTFSAKGSYFLLGVFTPATALCLWYFICPQNVLSTFPSFQASLARCHLTTLQGLLQESSFHEALLHIPIITMTTTALAGRDRFSSLSLLKTSISSTAITLLTVYLKVLVVCFGYCLLTCFVFV